VFEQMASCLPAVCPLSVDWIGERTYMTHSHTHTHRRFTPTTKYFSAKKTLTNLKLTRSNTAENYESVFGGLLNTPTHTD